MNPSKPIQQAAQTMRRRPLLLGLLAIILVAVIATFTRSNKPAAESSFYEVRRGDFLISVVEGGTIEAINEVVVRSEVEGTARIIHIVPEGTYVKKGDLLVELDSSSSQDAVNQQQINVEKAHFAVIQAEKQLEIQKSAMTNDLNAARLKVELADLALKKFTEGQSRQLKRNAEIEITNVFENLAIAEDKLEWSEKLYKKGYETKANLDRDRLTVNQTKLKLEQAKQELWMIETFDDKKTFRELETALDQAKEDLKQVKLQGESKLAQCEADYSTQQRTMELSQAKLERDKRQLVATKIYAPQDGLVVYAGNSGGGGRFSSESMIEGGATVRNRQELIKLPDVSGMKLLVKIHESHIGNIRPGQLAYIVLDSMPDQRFNGAVNKVAPLPDSSSRWANPNLKVYATEVFVTDDLPNVKPGVSARAEIVITNIANAITVPIQAVTSRKGKQVVFLAENPTTPVPVVVGMYNTKFIQIVSGLSEGDRILLSPPQDPHGDDLGGAVIADGESVPTPDTNRVARSASAPPTDLQAPRQARVVDESALQSRAFASANGTEPATATPPGDGGVRGSGGRGGFPGSEEMIKQFDTNGDGQLDDQERNAMRERFGGAGGQGRQGGGNRMSREEMLKQFDTNGDGEIDEQERSAMRERFGGSGGGGGGGGGQNREGGGGRRRGGNSEGTPPVAP